MHTISSQARTAALAALVAVAAVVVAIAASAAAAKTRGPQAPAFVSEHGRGSGYLSPARRPSAVKETAKLVSEIALARRATAKYVNDLALAKANGYVIITKMIPNMGYHFMNPKITTFDVRKPPILVYAHNGSSWQLGALEWVFTKRPARPPLPGATYGTFGAGCHYTDGTYVAAKSQDACPATAPHTGAAFNFWHPLLFTLHVWIWSPNPAGLYSGTNPLAAAYKAVVRKVTAGAAAARTAEMRALYLHSKALDKKYGLSRKAAAEKATLVPGHGPGGGGHI